MAGRPQDDTAPLTNTASAISTVMRADQDALEAE